MVTASFFSPKEEKFFRQALYCDIVRGKDSTGIFTVDKDKEANVRICKKAYPSYDFLQLDTPKWLVGRGNKVHAMVGHNRAATLGVVNDSNAHPFTYGDITLVHNGTLKNYSKLEGYYVGASDSRLLTRAIADKGIQEAVDSVTGAYALVWHDASDNTINFLRNDQREFSIALGKSEREVYFASEGLMLDWLLDRNNINADNAAETPVDTHIKLKLGEGTKFKPVMKEVKKHTTVTVVGGCGGKVNNFSKNQAKREAKRAQNVEKAEAIKDLQKEGITLPVAGQEISGYFYNFTRYNRSPDKGYITGNMSDNPYLHIEIHNQDLKDFEEGEYDFKIAAISWQSDVKEFLIRGTYNGLKAKVLYVGENKEETPVKKREVLGLPTPPKVITKTTSPGKTIPRRSLRRGDTSVGAGAKNGKTNLGAILGRAYEQHRLLNTVKEAVNDEDNSSRCSDTFPYFGPEGCKVSQEVFDKLTIHGCSCCTGNLFASDSESIEWRNKYTPICITCQEEERYGFEGDAIQASIAMTMEAEMDRDMPSFEGCPPWPLGHTFH